MKESIKELNNLLIESLNRSENVGLDMDLGDFGNIVGIVVQKLIDQDPNMDIDDFYRGVRHGISLIDGTHG